MFDFDSNYEESANICIPYMGSKSRLSKKIVDHILLNNPKCLYLYDLFGGGASISLEALSRSKLKKVIYNEIDTGVVEFLRSLLNYGVTDEYYQFINSETFDKYKNDNTWFGGFCKLIWSFGNNQKNYLYSKKISLYKENYNKIVMHDDKDALRYINHYLSTYFIENYNIDEPIILTIPKNVEYAKRKSEIMKQLRFYATKYRVTRFENLIQLQNFERVQRLQNFSSIKNKHCLEISNKSYEHVEINTPIEETILYLDPPYKNTFEYQHIINYETLYEFIEKSPYKIYISEYDSPFFKVNSFVRHSSVSQTQNQKIIENLYCNRKE